MTFICHYWKQIITKVVEIFLDKYRYWGFFKYDFFKFVFVKKKRSGSGGHDRESYREKKNKKKKDKRWK